MVSGEAGTSSPPLLFTSRLTIQFPFPAVAARLILVALTVLGTGCATDLGGGDRGDAGRGPRGRAGAGRQMARHDQQQPQIVWKQYDLNGDGKITPGEFMAVRAICFAKYDANSDGLLTRPEVKKFFSSPLGDRIDAVFSQADLDKDGMISREEFDRESDRLFRQLDANGDLVDRRERAQQHDPRGARRLVHSDTGPPVRLAGATFPGVVNEAAGGRPGGKVCGNRLSAAVS